MSDHHPNHLGRDLATQLLTEVYPDVAPTWESLDDFFPTFWITIGYYAGIHQLVADDLQEFTDGYLRVCEEYIDKPGKQT